MLQESVDERKLVGAILWLVNVRALRIEYTKGLHEDMFGPV